MQDPRYAGGFAMTRYVEKDSTRFTRWYIEAFHDIRAALTSNGIDEHSSMVMAAGVLNATLFHQFIRSASDHSARIDIARGTAVPCLDAFISSNDRHKCAPIIWERVERESERFHFSINGKHVDPDHENVVPEMLDDACEALSRSLAGEEKIASRGAYYTPREEISFMCKLAATRYLQEHLKSMPPTCVEYFVFNHESLIIARDQGPCMTAHDARSMIAALLSMRILDPACGSGAFLVGMADILLDLISRLAALHDVGVQDPDAFIQRVVLTLHGIDSDALAIQVARLRVFLWQATNAGVPCTTTFIADLPSLNTSIVKADFFWVSRLNDIREFDVVIGNPPYVRQEDIKPGQGALALPGRDEKSRYKNALIGMLMDGRPRVQRISRACDLYVYFFIKAVQVLRDGGELCFITSNTWLDAKFGQELQDFLLEHTSHLSIFDFDRRSFGIADINTVITACTRRDGNNPANHVASFVHFKIPPGRVCYIPPSPEVMARQEPSGGNMHEFRATFVPPSQVVDTSEARLVIVHPGAVISRNAMDQSRYQGKWRVQYLNEHDIFYTLLRKGARKLVPLGMLASVKAGCYSGINDFFYVTKGIIEQHGIEPSYIQPLLRSARDVRTLAMRVPEDSHVVVVPPLTKAELLACGHGGIVSYIAWGESQLTKRGQKTAFGIPWPQVESVKHRTCWYSLSEGNLQPARLFMQYIAHDRFYCPWSSEPVISDRCFHRVNPIVDISVDALAAVLNSSLQACMVMITGRTGLGGGALKLEAIDAKSMLVLDPRLLAQDELGAMIQVSRKLGERMPRSIHEECGLDPSLSLEGQTPSPMPDRAALDTIMFDALGLDDEERVQVYRAACSSVDARLKKARSAR